MRFSEPLPSEASDKSSRVGAIRGDGNLSPLPTPSYGDMDLDLGVIVC
jgi:hypothetical protein